MNKFIINIEPKYEDKLMKIAIIIWKSSLVKGQYIISTNNIGFLKSLPYVKNINIDVEGESYNC
ncbi:MAG: hypothetical protein LIR50_00265 [Bacillota bacterium]|nr:hypothetical protein [Bacillota bacterium]